MEKNQIKIKFDFQGVGYSINVVLPKEDRGAESDPLSEFLSTKDGALLPMRLETEESEQLEFSILNIEKLP